MKFHPNTNYFYANPSDRLKLIFPQGWDLSEAEKLSGTKHRERIAYEADDVDRQYGATWFLDRVAEVTGVKEDLVRTFDGNREIVDDILTMAYFPFIDNLSYGHLELWQREGEYAVGGNGDNVIAAKKYKVNLYFNPFKRAEDQMDLERATDEQCRMMDDIIASKQPVADTDDTVKKFNQLNVKFKKNGAVASYTVNEEKRDIMLLTSGFFASKTFGVDFDPLQAMDNYGIRDEQEKCFGLQKGPLGQDRLRTWSEAAKHGRMFICFVGLILASYVRSVHKSNDYLRNKFGAIEDILAEMRSIRCIEHQGRMKFITSFVGAQVDICKAFGFEIPEGSAPDYVSRKKSDTPRRGRPAKPKVERQEL